VPTQTNSLQSLIPHMHVPPQEVCPFSSQQSLDCPTSLPGLQQQARQEVSEPCSCSLVPSGNQFPTILSPREIAHGLDNLPLQYPMGLTTHFFSPSPERTRYRYGIDSGMDTGTGRYEGQLNECVNDDGMIGK
jgi:hypothetical protein